MEFVETVINHCVGREHCLLDVLGQKLSPSLTLKSKVDNFPKIMGPSKNLNLGSNWLFLPILVTSSAILTFSDLAITKSPNCEFRPICPVEPLFSSSRAI